MSTIEEREARRLQARQMSREGHTIAEIVDALGVTRQTVKAYLERARPFADGRIGSPWPAKDAALTELWGQELSTKEIGRRLGISKNAVVGRARMIGLSRPSPIRRRDESVVVIRRVRSGAHTLPPLPAPPVARAPAPKPAVASQPPVVTSVAPGAAPSPIAAAASRPVPRVPERIRECCWPIGEPRTRGFRYCDDPAEPGRPYCASHARKAYVKRVRPQHDEVAA